MMPRSLNDIATKVDEVADALQLLAEGIAGPGNAAKAVAQIWTAAGDPIDIRALANEIRQHAMGLSNT